MTDRLTDTPQQREEREKSNLVCNIHWAAVQKELVASETPSLTNNTTAQLLSQASPSISWTSQDESAESSERNSWSSISLSSSSKTASQHSSRGGEIFPDCGFSRASTPSTEAIRSSMMDDISLEDVEQFEEARLAQVRRKVSRVDSLKKFLFSSRLEEKKNRANSAWQRQRVVPCQPGVNSTMESGTCCSVLSL